MTRKLLKLLVGVVGIVSLLVGLFGFGSVPAVFAATKAENSPAINTVNCGNRTDFLELHFYDGSTVCFANAGTITQSYSGVQFITTGNNAGLFETSQVGNESESEWVDHVYPFYKETQFDWPESYGPIAITTIYAQLPTVTLTAGQELYANQDVPSNNGEYMLVMQEDGNLVLYNTTNRTPLWASNTAGDFGAYLAVQNDGNSVVYNANGTPLWASNTSGNPGTDLTVQDDGNVVISNASGTPLWASNANKTQSANPAYATYPISFTASTAPIDVNVRSGPGTSYSLVGKVGPNTSIPFSYLAYGTLVNDYWINWPDPRWYGFNDNGAIYWIASALIGGNPPSSQLSNANRAIAWAIDQQGSQNWDGYCEAFVENAYGTSYQYGSAQAAYNSLHTANDWSPDIGALVWFAPNSGNGWYGHVGLYIGSGEFLSATDYGVKILSMSAWNNSVASYEGWGDAPSSWPGHP